LLFSFRLIGYDAGDMTRIAHTVLDSETGYACVIRAGRHPLTADESTAHGGTDTGPAPYQLLLSGLAACTAITLRMVAARKGWDLGSIHVDVELHKDEGADRIVRAITLTALLNDEQKATLADIAEKTPVTKTIKAGAKIETKFL
jgi:putative redox protein